MKKSFLLLGISLIAGTAIFAQVLNINITQVAGNCSSNAQINVVATGGASPYLFHLTAGAAGVTYPTSLQSGANFSGLKPGIYTVEVQDNLGAIASKNITVTTSYVSLAISSVSATPNHCPLNPDGTVTINVLAGKTPYSYTLLQAGTIIYGPQSNKVFTAVTDGTYTAQVTDACGEIRTFAITVALNDFKWTPATSDNVILNSGYGSGTPAAPFDTTKMSDIYDGPLLFTCDSIAFRIFNSLTYNGNDLPARGILRRVYIKDLASGTIIWDNTFKPSTWPGGYTSPSVHLKINTNYRFYFDDLCNDTDSTDRNYNYANTNYYTPGYYAQKVCGGYNLTVSCPSNWNIKNTYNSPYDTITIINSTLAGDTTVGKSILVNYADRSASQPLLIHGIVPGNTYTIQVKTICGTYTKSVYVNAPPALSANISVASGACKINTAILSINISNYPVTVGNMVYRINSGPVTFTDTTGNVYTISYPIIDSVPYTNRISLRNFPKGTYSIDVWDQCGTKAPTMVYTVADADVVKISGLVTANQQCTGASSIAYNNIFNQRFSGTLVLQKKNTSGVYGGLFSYNYNSTNFPASTTFSSLADGDYRVIVMAASGGTSAAPIPPGTCDTLFKQDITLQYQIPLIDTASGYICTAGSSDGRITLFGKKGAKPYQFQMIDGSGNALSAYQTDSTFTGLSKGLYNFRIKDNCGNATLYAFQIDTLKSVAITPPMACKHVGDSLVLTADSIYQALYTWAFSSSSTIVSTTRVLSMPFLKSNDFGSYMVSYKIPGCNASQSTLATVSNCSALPVKLESFTAAKENGYVLLNWAISGGTGVKLFNVQRSLDNGRRWETIGNETAKDNNSVQQFYSFTDDDPNAGANLYRLQIIDNNGSITYSTIKQIEIDTKSSMEIYPNPVGQEAALNIQLKGLEQGIYKISMVSASGQTVKSMAFTASNMGTVTLVIPTGAISSGTYIISVKGNTRQFSKIVVVNNQ